MGKQPRGSSNILTCEGNRSCEIGSSFHDCGDFSISILEIIISNKKGWGGCFVSFDGHNIGGICITRQKDGRYC